MNTVLECLRELQELDRKITNLRESPGSFPDLKKTQEGLGSIRSQELEKLRDLKNLNLNINQTKVGSDLCRQRIIKTEGAQKEIKTPDEFQAATKELDQLKVLEQGLELKESTVAKEIETVSAELTEIQGKRETLEKSLKAQSDEKRIKDQEIAAGVREIEDKKSHLQSQILPKYFSLYQKLVNSRGGTAVAEVRGALCGGCNMILPAQFVNDVRRLKTIEQCPSCKRILLTSLDKNRTEARPENR